MRTWPRGFQQKIFFIRDFYILDQSGRKVAAASSAWLLIDVQKRRMLVPEKLDGRLPLNDGLRALDEDLERLVMPKDLAEKRTVQADYSMVDIMGHVNNTRYVDWVMDCFPFEHHRSHRLAWLQVNYNSEVLPGEQAPGCRTGREGPLPLVRGRGGANSRQPYRRWRTRLRSRPGLAACLIHPSVVKKR